jgi:hypothetical protein
MNSGVGRLPPRMSSRLRKLPLVGLLMLALLALGACGESRSRVSKGTYAGESGASAPYLNVGPLIYQVQLSRELNPYSVEDSSYLQGLTPAQRRLLPGQEWFGVFVQVYNDTNRVQLAASAPSIIDTQDNQYTPVVPDATNEYAYRGGLVPGDSRVPVLGSTAANGPTQGALLLYKIGIVSLDNRPLELKIVDPINPSQRASAELDV